MKRELMERLRCPKTGQHLTLKTPEPIADAIDKAAGWFRWTAHGYENPQTPARVRLWLEAAGLVRVEVFHEGNLVGRGCKR